MIKRGKEEHNPDGTGDTVKKYLWISKKPDIMGAGTHPGQKDREKNAHQLQTALAHTDRAQHEERGFKACRWPEHKYDCVLLGKHTAKGILCFGGGQPHMH